MSNTREVYLYPLEHQYTRSSLASGITALKGKDAAKGRSLQSVCPEEGVYWFIGHLTRVCNDPDIGFGYTTDEEDAEETVSLTYAVTPAGNEINIFDSIDAILAEGFYEDRGPDSEDEGEFTGNESMPSTYRYHDTVILLALGDAVWGSTTNTSENLTTTATRLKIMEAEVSAHPDELTIEEATNGLKRIIQNLIAKTQLYTRIRPLYTGAWYYEPESIPPLLEHAASLGRTIGQTFLVRDVLQSHFRNGEWSDYSELITLVAKEIGKDTLCRVPSGLTFTYANNMRKTFESVGRNLPHAALPALTDLARTHMYYILPRISGLNAEDVLPLVELSRSLQLEKYSEIILPELQKCDHEQVLRFMIEMASDQNLQQGLKWAAATYEHMAKAKPSIFKPPATTFDPTFHGNTLRAHLLGDHLGDHLGDYFRVGGSSEVMQILERALKMELETPAIVIVEQILSNASTCGQVQSQSKWPSTFTIIEEVVTAIARARIPAVKKAAGPLTRVALEACISLHLKSRPTPPTDWSRTTHLSCGCEPHRNLNAFLASPMQSHAGFTYNADIRKHLENSFYSRSFARGDYTFTTQKGRLPFTLVITKTTNEFKRTMENWEKDGRIMRSQLLALEGQLMNLVGDRTWYNGLLQLEVRPQKAGPAAALHRISESAENSRMVVTEARKKRKLEVVDLTDDI
ncbi:hypothetical protein EJ04DRAFT_571033 [Polyplosphaeria fusca]|uniref:Uncharacterized protein n=1 Tax=Polyplosphaeria fusca TaxID=682080 RepID=A0A9P4UVC3_9PLEO|nr:hypothetical protein EJ04DRAFT_571033 [Polyplosphaeria fusca]